MKIAQQKYMETFEKQAVKISAPRMKPWEASKLLPAPGKVSASENEKRNLKKEFDYARAIVASPPKDMTPERIDQLAQSAKNMADLYQRKFRKNILLQKA